LGAAEHGSGIGGTSLGPAAACPQLKAGSSMATARTRIRIADIVVPPTLKIALPRLPRASFGHLLDAVPG
jgi:hypothetical protein